MNVVGRSTRSAFAITIIVMGSAAFAEGTEPTDSDHGAWLTPALVYDGSALANVRGGARSGSTYGGGLHLKLTARGDGLGWPGASAFVDVLTIRGGRPSRLVGDAQGTDNLEGPSGTLVEEAWVQHNFSDSDASILIGIYDLNSEFYRVAAAGLFLNSSFGVGPEFAQSGIEGPSIFPRTSAGLRVAMKPTANTVLRAAVLDGVPVVRPDGSHAAFRGGDGLLTVLEFAWLSRGGVSPAPSSEIRDRIGRYSALIPYNDKLAAGTWHYTKRFADLSDTDSTGAPLMRQGSSGAYVLGERLLVGDDARSGRRLSAFGQAGVSDVRTNRFGTYIGAGIVASGWGPMGEEDQAGLSVAQARNGHHYMLAQASTPPRRAETTLELSYLRQASKYVTVQPDIQYVIHPNTDPALADALVLQIRFEIAF